MKVFLSWSGQRCKAIAEALYEWLPNVIQTVEPWISSEDIDKGEAWLTKLMQELDDTSTGVFCCTPENVHKPWLVF